MAELNNNFVVGNGLIPGIEEDPKGTTAQSSDTSNHDRQRDKKSDESGIKFGGRKNGESRGNDFVFDKEDRSRGKKLTRQKSKVSQSSNGEKGGLKNSLDMLRNGLEALRDRYKNKKEKAMRGTDERHSDDSLQ